MRNRTHSRPIFAGAFLLAALVVVFAGSLQAQVVTMEGKGSVKDTIEISQPVQMNDQVVAFEGPTGRRLVVTDLIVRNLGAA